VKSESGAVKQTGMLLFLMWREYFQCYSVYWISQGGASGKGAIHH